MRTRVILVAFLGLGALFGCRSATKQPHPSPPVLTVMTYNIHAGVGMDKRLDLERIAAVIRAQQPDFVALQEVDQGTKRSGGIDQPAELARLTNMHVAFGAAMPFQGGEYGNAVLSRRPIASSRVLALPWKEGGRREPRCAVAATVKLPGNGGSTIEFISTHFDHTAEPSDRAAQAETVNDNWGGGRKLMILAGDLNCEAGSPPMKTLGRAWTLVSGTDPASPTCCGAEPKVTIDHVFMKPAERWKVVDARVIDEPMASDHRPVLVKLEMNNEPRFLHTRPRDF